MTYMSSPKDPLRLLASRPVLRSRAPIRRSTGLRDIVLGLVDWAIEWQRRAEERQHVLELDERLLRDMGTTRPELLRALDGEPPRRPLSWRMRGWGM
jgi:uncharacterized protein YjiS (DUF1127 family)